jgi:hypothetical protein
MERIHFRQNIQKRTILITISNFEIFVKTKNKPSKYKENEKILNFHNFFNIKKINLLFFEKN